MSKRTTKHPAADEMTEMAVLDFEPFPPSILDKVNHFATWEGINNPHLVNLRLAIATNGKTKLEVCEAAQNLWSHEIAGLDITGEPGNLFTEMLEGFHETIERFEAVIEFMKAAECRMMCALAAVEEHAERKH